MLSVIVPVYNEKNLTTNIKKLHHSIKAPHEIIIIDDGSDFFRFTQQKNTRYFKKPFNEGKGAAVKTGLKYAQGELVLVIDGDLQINPNDLDTFIKIMELYNADAVIGNKRHEYSVVGYSPLRWIISNSYNLLCRLLFNIQLRDTQTGMKLFKREALRKVMGKVMCKRFAFDIEVIIAMRENSMRVVDAPVLVKRSVGGCANLRNITQTLIDTLAVFYRRSIGWYR